MNEKQIKNEIARLTEPVAEKVGDVQDLCEQLEQAAYDAIKLGLTPHFIRLVLCAGALRAASQNMVMALNYLAEDRISPAFILDDILLGPQPHEQPDETTFEN